MTLDKGASLQGNDDAALWLAACDERLASGEPIASLDEVGVPAALRPQLELEAAWCQLVRRIWPHSTEPELPPRNLWSGDKGCLPEEHPTELGRFLIRRELGRGSFGIVYLAYDPRLRRELALKVPRGEVLLSSELRARFRNEAMAAAGLDHPNIVAVYEAGQEGPCCFIASAYCPGITLAAWLRRRTKVVPHRMAAKLVAALADAVEHAHRRGVLHRDLKPSNVLLDMPVDRAVDRQDDDDASDLVPRVTDFGLAKLLDDEQGTVSPVNPTQSGMLVGTPSYMAPEQAEGKRGAVSPAADIYSLGVILYEVLTGRPPFQGDSVLDTLVLVRTQDVLPPSKLRQRLPRDLETICLHCLNRQPQARYRAAGELADDLRRFLAGEPIRARPAHPIERAVKWIRRHPAVAALAGATTTAAIAIAMIIVIATVRLKHQRDLAESRRLEAVANLKKARQAVDRMLTRVSAERLKEIPQVEPVQRALLEDALEFYRDFARDAHGDPEILIEASRAYYRLGRKYHVFGRLREADSCCREALAIQEKLVAAAPTFAAYAVELGATRIELARVCRDLGQPSDAIELLRKATESLDTIAATDRNDSRYRSERASLANVRAMVLEDMGQREAAEPEYRKGIELFDELAERFPAVLDHRVNAGVCRHNLTILMEESGRLDEAEAMYRQSVTLWEGLAARDPTMPNYRSKLALTEVNLAILLEKTGRASEAEQSYRRTAVLRASLTKDFPNTPWQFIKLAEANRELARLYGNRGDLTEARRLREQAVVATRAALAITPENAEFRRCLVSECASLVETLISLKMHDEATKSVAEIASLAQDSAKDILRAGSLMAQCVPLAAADSQLPGSRRAELAEAYAKCAIELVGEAARKGYRDVDAVRKDHGFDSLRARPDFGVLLAGMATPPGGSAP